MNSGYTENIFPSDIIKFDIIASERKNIAVLRKKADDTCRYKISPAYIHTAFNRFKKGYYYTNNSNEIIGFCLWKEYSNIQKDGSILKKMYIILICADYNDYKLGRKILYDIESYCIDNKIPIITLEAANDELIKYYQHGGFVLINKITKEMMKEVKMLKIYKKNSKTRKVKRNLLNSEQISYFL